MSKYQGYLWRVLLGVGVAFCCGLVQAEQRDQVRLPEITWVGTDIDRAAELSDIEAAKSNVVHFAIANHLEAGLSGLDLKSIDVFSSKKIFDEALIAADGMQHGTTLPPTFVGVVDAGILYACSAPVAEASNPTVRSREDYIKLLTHELTHALHIALLHGDESKMGPKWFFEGLAIYAADQYPDDPAAPSNVYESVISGQSKKDYRLYVAAFRRLAAAYPIAELIDRASRPGFEQWAAQAVPDRH